MGPDYDRIELFVPEGDRRSKTTPVDLHDRWVISLMRTCTNLFGGATASGCDVRARTLSRIRLEPPRRQARQAARQQGGKPGH